VKALTKDEKHTKFCPKCGSHNIQWASGLPQLWSIWECKDCGYRGALVVEDGELAKKIRKRFLKQAE
jgi:DNA-directed RNA polymerase subunit M